MVAIVWQVEVHPQSSSHFEHLYGANGAWTKLSRRSRSFIGSSFLRDLSREDRYLLVEYWSEMVVYERHLQDFADEVRKLEAERARHVVRIEPLGVFTALDVPDRAGPVWSRRSR